MKVGLICLQVNKRLPEHIQDRMFCYLRGWSSEEFDTEQEAKQFVLDKLRLRMNKSELEESSAVIEYLSS